MEPKRPYHLEPRADIDLQPYLQNDRINLFELWRILASRKGLIGSTLLACLVGGGLLTYLISPLYQSRAVISIGHVADIGLLESPGELVARLKEEYRVDDTSEGPRKLPNLSAVSQEKLAGASIVTLQAQGRTAQSASRFLSGVASKIIQSHRQRFDDIEGKLQDRLARLQREVDNLRQTVALIDGRIQALGDSDPSMIATLAVEKGTLLKRLPDLNDQISDLQMKLTPVKSTNTTLLHDPTVPLKPERPRPLLYMTLACMLGLVVGVFAAFVAEFMAQVKARHTPPQAGSKAPM